MPTYNYKCNNCDATFSIFQKMNDNPILKCQNCNGSVKRIISGGSGMIFKGDGFYITDYAKSNCKDNSNSTKVKKKEGSNNE